MLMLGEVEMSELSWLMEEGKIKSLRKMVMLQLLYYGRKGYEECTGDKDGSTYANRSM